MSKRCSYGLEGKTSRTAFKPLNRRSTDREKQSHTVPVDAVDPVAVHVPRHDECLQGRHGDDIPEGSRE